MDIKDKNGNILAKSIISNQHKGEKNFHTKNVEELQVANFMLQKEDIILRHYHPNQKRSINTTSEVIVVQSGTLEVDIYDKNHEFVDSFELNEGDIGILIDGGHGIKIIEDCKFVEVKQGPYDEKTDKVRF